MKKSLFITSLYVAMSLCGKAQTNGMNICIQADAGNVSAGNIKNHFYAHPGLGTLQLTRGLTAAVRMIRNVSVEVSYSSWQTWGVLGLRGTPEQNVGQIVISGPYKLINAGIRYNMYKKRHNIYGVAGLSYTWGHDIYYESFWQMPGAFDIHETLSDPVAKHYLGVNVGAGYNYALVKNRINVGLDTRFIQFTDHYWQHYLNVHLGYNFKLPKLKLQSKE